MLNASVVRGSVRSAGRLSNTPSKFVRQSRFSSMGNKPKAGDKPSAIPTPPSMSKAANHLATEKPVRSLLPEVAVFFGVLVSPWIYYAYKGERDLGVIKAHVRRDLREAWGRLNREPDASESARKPAESPISISFEKDIPTQESLERMKQEALQKREQLIQAHDKALATLKDELKKAEADAAAKAQEVTQLKEEMTKAVAEARGKVEKELTEGLESNKTVLATGFKDLASASDIEVRLLVKQLSLELEHAAQLEGMRLERAVQAAEDRASRLRELELEASQSSYELRLKNEKERADLQLNTAVEGALAARQREMEAAVDAKLKSEREKETALLEARMKTFEDEAQQRESASLNAKSEELSRRFAAAAEERVHELAKLRGVTSGLEAAIVADADYERACASAARLTLTALALGNVSASSTPLHRELELIRKLAGEDEVVAAAVAALPVSLQNTGVPTTARLSEDFRENVRGACRAADLAAGGEDVADQEKQEGVVSRVLSRGVGKVFSAITLQPEGLVQGDSTDAVLSRMAFHLSTSSSSGLLAALREAEALEGNAKLEAAQWLEEARARLALEQSVTMVRSHVALQVSRLL